MLDCITEIISLRKLVLNCGAFIWCSIWASLLKPAQEKVWLSEPTVLQRP